jgi:hypothetical protein
LGILRAMNEPNALVNFRLDRDRPMRIKWTATDGVPGECDMAFIHEDSGRVAIEGEDYEIRERPRDMAHKLTRRNA